MYIGQNIKSLRKRLGMTADDLAKVIDKTRHSVTQYETGKSTPPLEVAMQLADFFKISLDVMLNVDLTGPGALPLNQRSDALQPPVGKGETPNLWDLRVLIETVDELHRKGKELEERIDTLSQVGK